MKNVSHLPYCYANHASIHHAIKFKVCSESLLAVPRSVIIDGIVSYGGSTGIGMQLPCKAYSEFFERNHLFVSVPVYDKKTLLEVDPIFREKLLSLCQFDDHQSDCMNHSFSLTTVYNLFDDHPQDYFFNAISLYGNKADAAYIRFTDSCACAAHVSKQDALYNSLMEFLERQSLLGSWLSKSYQYAINPIVLKEITPYSDLVEQLLENGDIYIYANGNELPGYTVIMFFFAHSRNDAVQYSVGSSSGLSLAEALLSSLEELYQCYTFLYNMESSVGLENKAGSGYHLNFRQFNSQETKSIIPFINSSLSYKINTSCEVKNLHKFTYTEVIKALSLYSKDIYYYYNYNKLLDLHFTKIVSPDFFSHMSINKYLNFENAYARKLCITRENAYLQRIPFP